MSEKPISPLRQRMLEDMSLRGFTPDTQRDYIRAVKKLAAFLGRSPGRRDRWCAQPAIRRRSALESGDGAGPSTGRGDLQRSRCGIDLHPPC